MWKIKMPFWHTAYKIQRRFMCQNHVNQLRLSGIIQIHKYISKQCYILWLQGHLKVIAKSSIHQHVQASLKLTVAITNRFNIIFSVVLETDVKKLLTFGLCECFTTASTMSSFFIDEQLICNDLARVLKPVAGKQPTASCAQLISDSRKQTSSSCMASQKHLKKSAALIMHLTLSDTVS